MIEQGRVAVDGGVVTEQGVKVVPGEQGVSLDGCPVELEPLVRYVLNKPRGVLSATDDPGGRRTVLDFLPSVPERVYHVGRLDYDSEGLLILTNDGELANRLMHPRYEIGKTYHVWLDRSLKAEERRALEKGMVLEGESMSISNVSVIRRDRCGFLHRMTLHEGKNRQIRRMVEALGLRVRRLKRVEIGPVRLDRMRSGEVREMRPGELALLERRLGLEGRDAYGTPNP
jgi:23S rRNA pseudouridine2605 synthase